ncbi:FKBP-type peptidyl-prolyl cis-trans isomerase [Actinomyces mediterranea]|uniref:FKBP-type peptidyl-prolyl cis-trans isomerase n=1 Tax=Actinomyces mediterranea TaxID=1871028 RepID=UPI0009706713|nr:hypothetical protein [Actinomyces mediterranea]
MSHHARARTVRRIGGQRIAAWIGAAVVLIALIAGILIWSPWSADTPDATPGQVTGALDSVAVSGRVGATPVVDIERDLEVNSLKARAVEVGEGRTITEGSPVLLSITTFDGTTGENLSPDGRPDLVVGTATEERLGSGLAQIVIGHTEGTRLLALHPVDTASAKTRIEVNVVDILGTIAYGAEEADADSGALHVAMRDEGPVITHAQEVPGGLTTQTLIKGDGVQLRDGDQIVAQFTVVGWTDGVVRSSTWQTGMPELIVLSDAMVGLQEALVDQRVGSRLAISIPPDLATGDDTLCVVIDLLGTEPGSRQGASGGSAAEQSS